MAVAKSFAKFQIYVAALLAIALMTSLISIASINPAEHSWTIGSGGYGWQGNIKYENITQNYYDYDGNVFLRQTFDGWAVHYTAEKPLQNSNPSWTRNTDGIYTESVSNGKLFINTSGTGTGRIYYERAGTDLNTSRGWMWEIRAKFVGGNSFYIDAEDGQYILQTIIKSDRLAFLESSSYYLMNTTDDYHVYRFIRNGKDVEIYVDGFLVLRIASSVETSLNRIVFGGYQNGETTEAYIDYFKYHENGNEPPKYVLSGSLTSVVKDAESVGYPRDVWKEIKIEGENNTDTWFHAYWNYSTNKITYQMQDIGIVTPGVRYMVSNARYGSFIIQPNTNDNLKTPELFSVTLFTDSSYIPPNATSVKITTSTLPDSKNTSLNNLSNNYIVFGMIVVIIAFICTFAYWLSTSDHKKTSRDTGSYHKNENGKDDIARKKFLMAKISEEREARERAWENTVQTFNTKKLINLIAIKNEISASDAARELGVDIITLRKSADYLEKNGFITIEGDASNPFIKATNEFIEKIKKK